jgi:hypothetical protein
MEYASLMVLSNMTMSGLVLWVARSVIMDLSLYYYYYHHHHHHYYYYYYYYYCYISVVAAAMCVVRSVFHSCVFVLVLIGICATYPGH